MLFGVAHGGEEVAPLPLFAGAVALRGGQVHGLGRADGQLAGRVLGARAPAVARQSENRGASNRRGFRRILPKPVFRQHFVRSPTMLFGQVFRKQGDRVNAVLEILYFEICPACRPLRGRRRIITSDSRISSGSKGMGAIMTAGGCHAVEPVDKRTSAAPGVPRWSALTLEEAVEIVRPAPCWKRAAALRWLESLRAGGPEQRRMEPGQQARRVELAPGPRKERKARGVALTVK